MRKGIFRLRGEDAVLGRHLSPANNSGASFMEVKSTAYGNLGMRAFPKSLSCS